MVTESSLSTQPIIERFGVRSDILCCLFPCAVLALMDEFSLQYAEETLDASVVQTVAVVAHAAGDATGGECLQAAPI